MLTKFLTIFFIANTGASLLCNVIPLSTVKQNGSLGIPFMNTMKGIGDFTGFFETGTLTGGTTSRAAGIFNKVYTVEFSDYFYNVAHKNLKHYQNISLLKGNSADILRHVAPTIKNENYIFFLDAHYSGGNTARGETNTPLMEEIEIILSNMPQSIIVIDDLRLCQQEALVRKQIKHNSEDQTVGGYPSLSEMQEKISRYNMRHELVIWGDVGVILSRHYYPNIALSSAFDAMTKSRFFEEKESPSSEDSLEVILAEKKLLTATAQEGAVLLELLNPVYGLCKPELFTTHYRIWAGLFELGQRHTQSARKLFNEAKEFGFPHWRLNLYIAWSYQAENNSFAAQSYLNLILAQLKEIGLEEESIYN